MLLATDEEATVRDGRRRIATFAEWIFGNDSQLFTWANDLGQAIIGHEIGQSIGRYQGIAEMIAETFLPEAIAGGGDEAIGGAAIIGDD